MNPLLHRKEKYPERAFKRKANADAFRKKLAALLGKEVEIFVENGFYKVRITGFGSRKEVDDYIPILTILGFTDIWIIPVEKSLVPPVVEPVKEPEKEQVKEVIIETK
ncbi:MAG: SPOR domain-containing protein [Bacteroidales bacterium]|nr:SPOR domain-containing protein [Bacteroidales bacterium]